MRFKYIQNIVQKMPHDKKVFDQVLEQQDRPCLHFDLEFNMSYGQSKFGTNLPQSAAKSGFRGNHMMRSP